MYSEAYDRCGASRLACRRTTAAYLGCPTVQRGGRDGGACLPEARERGQHSAAGRSSRVVAPRRRHGEQSPPSNCLEQGPEHWACDCCAEHGTGDRRSRSSFEGGRDESWRCASKHATTTRTTTTVLGRPGRMGLGLGWPLPAAPAGVIIWRLGSANPIRLHAPLPGTTVAGHV